MPTSDGIRARISGDARGHWLILTDEVDIDEAQLSGRWLKCDDPREVRR